MRKHKSIAERFWSKVDKRSDDECWPWTASKYRNGYGQIGVGGRGAGITGAHRISWELHQGPIPDGLFVCHRCDDVGCVNPSHLFLGTPKANTQDMVKKGRARHKSRFRHDRQTLLEIASSDAKGRDAKELCQRLGVSNSHFYQTRKLHAEGRLNLPPE